MVEDVEDLPTQLNATRLAETNILRQRRVESRRRRSINDVPTGVSDSVHSRRRICEARGIKPLQERVWGAGVRIANRVRPGTGLVPFILGVGGQAAARGAAAGPVEVQCGRWPASQRND